MDAYVVTAIGLASAYVGFVTGVFVVHRFVRTSEGGGGGGGQELGFEPPPVPGSGLALRDFDLWETELEDTVERGRRV